MATRTGFEPVPSSVTDWRSNQLNYRARWGLRFVGVTRTPNRFPITFRLGLLDNTFNVQRHDGWC